MEDNEGEKEEEGSIPEIGELKYCLPCLNYMKRIGR